MFGLPRPGRVHHGFVHSTFDSDMSDEIAAMRRHHKNRTRVLEIVIMKMRNRQMRRAWLKWYEKVESLRCGTNSPLLS